MLNKFDHASGGVCAPKGFLAAGMHCGLKKNKSKNDLALIFSVESCDAAAVYTQNKVKGAPLLITRDHLENGKARAIICNSGNANTCNADGPEKAKAMCRAAAESLGICETDVIVASTGVIGVPLPIEPITDNIGRLKSMLSENGSEEAGKAILTTDLKVKETAISFTLGGAPCKLGGIAKGSGMFHPNMATMLCFLTTDADISPQMLQKALSASVRNTFNMASVDGDTSTSDMACILANGTAKNPRIDCENEDFHVFLDALNQINTYFSREIARDGEGATKLLECRVDGAGDDASARAVAKSVISSSLFKAAMFGSDANWGRILCAIGYSDADFDIGRVGVWLSSEKGRIQVCENGAGCNFSEEQAKIILKEPEVYIDVKLGEGPFKATAWGCDLSYDYVKINGDYRS